MSATALSTVCAGVVLPDVPPLGRLSATRLAAYVIYAVTTTGLVGIVVALRDALTAAGTARLDLGRTMAANSAREASLASILASSIDCIKVLDSEGRLTFANEGGQRIVEVSDEADVASTARAHDKAKISRRLALTPVSSGHHDGSNDREMRPRWTQVLWLCSWVS